MTKVCDASALERLESNVEMVIELNSLRPRDFSKLAKMLNPDDRSSLENLETLIPKSPPDVKSITL